MQGIFMRLERAGRQKAKRNASSQRRADLFCCVFKEQLTTNAAFGIVVLIVVVFLEL